MSIAIDVHIKKDNPLLLIQGFRGSSKESVYTTGDIRDVVSIPGLRRSSREGNGNPLQYSCLEKPMDGGAWQTTVHGVAKSWTRLHN